MKKLMAVLMALILFPGTACMTAAHGEESFVSDSRIQGAYDDAFLNNLFSAVEQTDLNSQDIVFSIEPAGSSPVSGRIGIRNQGLEITVSNASYPGEEVFIRADENALVITTAGGQTIRIAYSEIVRLVQDPGLYLSSLGRIGQLFLDDVLMPCLDFRLERTGTVFHFSMDGSRLISVLTRFGDDIAAYAEEGGNIPALISQIVPLFLISRAGASYGDQIPGLPQLWPLLKQQLLQADLPFLLEGDLVLGFDHTVSGKLTLTASNYDTTVIALDFHSLDLEQEFTLTAELSGSQKSRDGEDSQTRSFAALDLSYDKLTGNLDADLDLPASSASFRFCGNIRPDCADLYITADTHSSYSDWESVHLFWSASGSVLTAGCSGFGSRGAAFAADLLWTDHLKRFSLNADRESLALEVVHDNDGNYTASLSLPYQRFSADVRGVISRNLFTADASWDQSSGRDGSGTASLRLLHRDDGFDLSGSFNTRRESGNLDLRWSPMIKTLHFANGDGGAFMASVLQNEDGGVRNIQINGPAWTAEYDREKLLIRTGREEITLIGRYESEWVHVLDITRKSTDSYYYYDDNPPDTETHAGIRTELSRDGQYWALRSTVTDVSGNQSLNLSVGTAGRDVP